MHAKEILTAFIRGTHPDPFIVSPCVSETMPSQIAGLPWNCPQDDPRMLEAKIRVGAECGFPPVIKHEQGSLELLVPEETVLEQTPEKRVVRHTFNTPRGPVGGILTYLPNSGHGQFDPVLEPEEEVRRQLWARQNLSDFQRFRKKVRWLVDYIGDRGLLCVNVSHPFYGVHGDMEKLIYLCVDSPELVQEATVANLEYLKKVVDAAAAEGVICFFAGQISKNMLSPAMIRQWIIPHAAAAREYCHQKGAMYYLHDCGKMQNNFDAGFFHAIHPDWLEGFDEPTIGDITDLKAIRTNLPRDTIIKGNFNIEFLAKAKPAEIEEATLRLLEKMAGYRHIVGGACSLLGATPLKNVAAMVKATARFMGK